MPSSRDLPNPGIKPRSPSLQVNSLKAEKPNKGSPQGKPNNTGAGSLFLLQWIFPIQESSWGSPILQADYLQQSYQGSPGSTATFPFCPCLDRPMRRKSRFAPHPLGTGGKCEPPTHGNFSPVLPLSHLKGNHPFCLSPPTLGVPGSIFPPNSPDV